MHAFKTNDAGRLIYPEQTYSCPKKSGKSAFAGMDMLTTTLVIYEGLFGVGEAVLDHAEGRTSLGALPAPAISS
jgi:hypothetical protein